MSTSKCAENYFNQKKSNLGEIKKFIRDNIKKNNIYLSKIINNYIANNEQNDALELLTYIPTLEKKQNIEKPKIDKLCTSIASSIIKKAYSNYKDNTPLIVVTNKTNAIIGAFGFFFSTIIPALLFYLSISKNRIIMREFGFFFSTTIPALLFYLST